jgi:hypothetical protein
MQVPAIMLSYWNDSIPMPSAIISNLQSVGVQDPVAATVDQPEALALCI